MAEIIKFYIVSENGKIDGAEEQDVASYGLDTAEKLQTAFKGAGRWQTIEIRDCTKRNAQKIEQGCLVPSDAVNFRYDATLEGQKRFAVMVERWSFTEYGEPTEQAYLNLPTTLSDMIDTALLRRLKPSAVGDRLFFRVWGRNSQNSEAAEETGATSTPA